MDLIQLLDSKVRCVVVAKRPVDLRLDDGNSVFVLQLPEGIRTAVGSRGGYGESNLVRVYQFTCARGSCQSVKVVEDQDSLKRLEIPYHAAALGIVQADGTERFVAGVVDDQLADSYESILAGADSPPD